MMLRWISQVFMQDRMSNQDRSGISARNTYTASIMQSCDLCSFPSLEWGGLRLEGVIVSEEFTDAHGCTGAAFR